jgi:hypothetical protein
MIKLSISNIASIAFVTALFSGVAGVSPVQAQTVSPTAGCFVAPARMSDAEISAFLAAPDSLLTQFSSGGLPLSNQARSLVGSSADALSPLIAVAAKANPGQAAAIGAGLARAARACATVNPEYASRIQDAIADSGNKALETAFLAANSETQTAALGGALGGGGSATGGAGAIGGGGTPGGGSNGSAGTTASTGSGSSSFSSGGGSGYYASEDGGSTTIVEGSATTASF